MHRAIAVVIFPGFQLLDAAGPTTAFEIAERFRPDTYDISLLAPGGGQVVSSSGLALLAGPLGGGPFDTIIASGGDIGRSMETMQEIVVWLRRTGLGGSPASVLAPISSLRLVYSTAAAPPPIGKARMTSPDAIRK